MREWLDISYGAQEAHKLDLYLPDAGAFALLVYFHGGGMEAGDKSHEKDIAQALCDKGIAMISANYRMYPEAQYPDFVQDAAAAVAWTFAHIHEYGDCTGIYVGGSSAGGYLSMMLCFDKQYLNAHGLEPTQVAGYLHDAGQPTTHFNVLRERGLDTRRVLIDEAAPLYHVGLAEKYAPMRFILAEDDMKNRKEQTELMLSTLRHFGYEGYDLCVLPGKHVKYLHRLDAQGENEFVRVACDFIHKTEAGR